MNVEIGSEAAQFPEKEYINGIFIAVCHANTAIGHSWKTIHWPLLYVYGVTKEFSWGLGMEDVMSFLVKGKYQTNNTGLRTEITFQVLNK